MRKRPVQTYGRKVKGCQNVQSDAVWSSGDRYRHVFSDSSDTDASSNLSQKGVSFNSSSGSLASKENVPVRCSDRNRKSRGKAGRLLRNNVKTVSYKEPADFTPKYVKPTNARKALKERHVFELSMDSCSNSMNNEGLPKNRKAESKAEKKQKKKDNKKNEVVGCDGTGESLESEIPRNCNSEMAKFTERFNFSEFDDYSFVISESVSPCVDKENSLQDKYPDGYILDSCFKSPLTPSTVPPIQCLSKSKAMMETSTPNNAVSIPPAHLRHCEKSPNPLNSLNLQDLDEHSPLLQCQVYLEQLSLSQVEHASPQLSFSQNDSVLNQSGVLSERLIKNVQNMSGRSRRNRTNSVLSVQSCGRMLESIAESSFDHSRDLFAESEVHQDHGEVTKEVENEAVLSSNKGDSYHEKSRSQNISAVTCSERQSSFHATPDHQRSSLFFSPQKTRTGRPFGNRTGSSVKDILTPVKNPRTQEIISPRTKVLEQCQQEDYISFEDYLTEGEWTECTKIGDGVYGEVFRVGSEQESLAIKIIPIEGELFVNDEKQKTFEEILPEIVISRELSELRYNMSNMTSGFVDVRSVRCLQGCYPELLLDQWDIYHNKKGSENDRPDFFCNDQLFVLFEFGDGGRDLESFQFSNMDQAKSVLHQVVCSLAAAEQELMFEHRDLHWGNILVKHIDEEMVTFVINDGMFEVPSHGVQATIIDFTLSRLTKDECTVYLDLSSDETLFQGYGDFQFEVYRMMKEVSGNNWRGYHPITNVYWVSYLTEKLIKEKTYKKKNQAMMRKFRNFHRNLLDDFVTVLDIITNSTFFD